MYELKSVTVEVCNGWSTVQANLNFSRNFTNKLYENWISCQLTWQLILFIAIS